MISNFEKFKISKEIVKALSELGYEKPTDIQDKVIKEFLLNKDLVVRAQTGSGKTASYVVPICEKIKWEENNPQALILTPTRELAVQVAEDVKNIGRFKRIKSVPVYGKESFKEQTNKIKGKTHVIVGTPGRVLDHIDRKTLITEDIKYLVIDEADEMLNMGFIRQIEAVFRRLPKKRVVSLFSATMPPEIVDLSKKYLHRPLNIQLENENLVVDKIDHIIYITDGKQKLSNLKALLIKEKPETCVVFCRTKENVDIAYDFLVKNNYSVNKIHGGMMQKDRLNVMEEFKKGRYRILVATDIASRGIDVENVTHVINLDIPLEKEAYVHRIGRSARAGKSGKAITFITKFEDRYLNDIEDLIGFKIKEEDINKLEYSQDEEEAAKKYLSKTNKKKIPKGNKLNSQIVKLYFNGGKKKKIRAVDFVGTISNIENINSEDIGIIEIKDNGSYVEILNGKGKIVLNAMKERTIKGKKLRVEIANK